MRVLFDGFWWRNGPIANQTVMREIIRGWARRFPEDQILLAIRSSASGDPDLDLPPNARVVTTRLAPQAVSNALELGILARVHRADVTVCHNYTPLIGRSIVFIHDLLFEDHPEWFTRKELVYFSPMAPLARRAAMVATSTTTEARRIERLHSNLRPVLATGLGISPALADADEQQPRALEDVSQFVLSVGRLNARKNLRVSLEGSMLASTINPQSPLIVVGSGEYSGRRPDLPQNLDARVSDGSVRFLGRVTDGELKWLYRRARGLVFMSRDEGFGLPPAEALHFSTPVIVSDTDVMREVVADRGTFVGVDDSSGVARAIDQLPERSVPPIEQLPRSGASDVWDAAASRLRAEAASRMR